MPRRRPGQLLRIEVSILGALRDAGGAGSHGFALARTIAETDESKRLTATGTLYRALHRLDEAGLVENWWEDPHEAAREGRPLRRLYRITGAGAAALARAQPQRSAGDVAHGPRIDPRFAS